MKINLFTFFCFNTTFLLFLILAIYGIITKNLKNFLFSLFFLTGSIIIIGEYGIEIANSNYQLAIFFHKLKVAGVILLILMFPITLRNFFQIKISKAYIFALAGITSILLVLLYMSNLIITDVPLLWGEIIKGAPGKIYIVPTVIVSTVAIYEYIIALSKYKKSAIYKKYLLIIFIGLAFGIISGVLELGFYNFNLNILKIPSIFTFGFFITIISIGATFFYRYNEIIYELQKVNKELKKFTEKVRIETLDLLDLIISTIEARDRYTAGHSKRVTNYALMIADALKLSDNEKELLKQACLVHDIGKIGVPESILNKPSSLTEEEYNIIKKHPLIGVEILSHFHHFVKLLPYIYHHHERIDGRGYPNGLKGKNIPLLARIIAVADTFDALTSDRPYRKAMPLQQAIKILQEVSGSQLDELIVSEFVKRLKNMA